MSLVHSGGINFIVHECNACFYVKLLVISCQVTRNWFAVKVAQVENLRVKFVFHTQIFPLFLFYQIKNFIISDTMFFSNLFICLTCHIVFLNSRNFVTIFNHIISPTYLLSRIASLFVKLSHRFTITSQYFGSNSIV